MVISPPLSNRGDDVFFRTFPSRLITLFVRWQTVCIGIPLLILIINFEKVYDGIMWIIRKIPFLGMQ